MKDLNKRLEALEEKIKSAADSPIWIDGKNNVIRIDSNSRQGMEITFPTVFDARCWLEKQIDKHPIAKGSYSVDNICDLFEDGEELKELIREQLPGPIGSMNGPYSADDLPGDLFGNLKTKEPADLVLWCLVGLMRDCSGHQFKERWEAEQLTDDDNSLMTLLFFIFAWTRGGDPEECVPDFLRLFHQVTGLQPA